MGLFRVRASTFALTYPKCDVKNQVVDLLLNKYEDIHFIAAAQEDHQDGSKHVHVLVEFNSKKEIRDERYFDVVGFHPNVQGCRNPKKWFEYISKEGTLITCPIKSLRY